MDEDLASLMENQTLPLSTKLSTIIHELLSSGKIKRLDLGILFYISFQDLSSPCVTHLATL